MITYYIIKVKDCDNVYYEYSKNYHGKIRNIEHTYQVSYKKRPIITEFERIKINDSTQIDRVIKRVEELNQLEQIKSIESIQSTQINQIILQIDKKTKDILNKFDSIEDASSVLNISVEKIEKVLNGESKSIGGFIFEYEKV